MFSQTFISEAAFIGKQIIELIPMEKCLPPSPQFAHSYNVITRKIHGKLQYGAQLSLLYRNDIFNLLVFVC